MATITFIQREIEDKLGPMLLSASLKAAGHTAHTIIAPYRNIQAVKNTQPDCLALSLCTPSVAWTQKCCAFLKKHMPDIPIILGGPHPTFFPDIINDPHVDAICIGEGETAMCTLARAYDGTLASIAHIPNLWVKTGGAIIKNDVAPLLSESELSALPCADRSLYTQHAALRHNPHKKIWTSRGCPYNCAYCFNHAYKKIYKDKGKLVRQRSVQSVIQELKELKQYGWHCLEIIDDQLLLSQEWTIEFCDRYEREIGLPFSCCSTAKQITPDNVKRLKQAGCKTILFAIESGTEDIRKNIYKKPITNTDIYNAADALHAHHMPFLTFNMVGLPTETPEDIYQTIKINSDIKSTYPWCSTLQPYPCTEISEYFAQQNATPAFSYSYFQTSTILDLEKKKLFSNSQKLFTHLVKHNASFDTFKKWTCYPPLHIDTLYPLIFYWHYGNDLRERYGLSWFALFRYWLYSRQ